MNKKAFTLMELLAVIVILAVIALIAIPITINVINNVQKNVFKNTAYGLIDAVRLQYAENYLDQAFEETYYTFPEAEGLKYGGKSPKGGMLHLAADGKISIAIYNDNWCATKGLDESKVVITKYVEGKCILKEEANVPLITLKGENSVYLNIGKTYNEAGYSIKTVGGEELSNDLMKISVRGQTSGKTELDTSIEEIYTITYTVTYKGKTSSETRTVHVGNYKPTVQIKPNGTSTHKKEEEITMTVSAFEKYSIDGFSYIIIKDNVESEPVTVDKLSETIKLTEEGTYKIKIIATDSEDNTNEYISEEYNIDTTGPTITFAEGDTTGITMDISEVASYDLKTGVVVTDNSNVVESVTVSGTLSATVGYFTVKYIATDGAGNTSSKVRRVFVKNNAVTSEGVFITSVSYKADTNANLDKSELSAYQTTLDTNINLSDTDSSSYATFTINIYNNTAKEHMFVGTIYNEETYSNENITFALTNLEVHDIISPKANLSFDITFQYNGSVDLEKITNSLQTSLEFKFESIEVKETLSGIEFNYLVKNGEYAPEGDVMEYYSVDENRLQDYTIKKIVFGKTSEYTTQVANLTAEPIDIYRTGSISLYRETLSDGKFTIYILSETGQFILNEDSSWMFDKLYELEEIVNLHLLDTSNVVKMRDMFCDCAKLKNVDLSNFDTSKVTNMIGMFARMYEIEYLDLTTFDTNNVSEIGQMFTGNELLKKIYVSDKWVMTDKIATEDGGGLFANCTSLVGGNGTTLTTTVDKTMAVVDTASKKGYLTKGYTFATGLEVNNKMKNLTQTQIDAWDVSTRYENTDIETMTFGQTKDYYEITSQYSGVPVDVDGSGVISLYRVPKSNGKYHVYILSNNGNFTLNADASWFFDKLIFLTQINNLNMLNTSKVTNMRDMFCDCQYLPSLDLSNFNTANVTTFEGMFARMYSIQTLDLSSFNTSKTTEIKNMFHLGLGSETHESMASAVPALKTIYVSNSWTTAKVDATATVFSGATNLVGGNGTVFNTNNISASYAVIDTASTPGYLTKK